jgi:hypothetical protein
MTESTPVLEKLVRARGVVFDVRGYPTDAGAQILPYLIEAAENDRWMHVAKIIGPFGQDAGCRAPAGTSSRERRVCLERSCF